MKRACPVLRAGSIKISFQATMTGSSYARRVLAVDDDHASAEALATLVRFWGFEVATAHDGTEALEVARNFRPGVVIMDLQMPRMNGLQAAKAMRAAFETLKNPVFLIALTGSAHLDSTHAARVGFDAYLPKPLPAQNLFKILDEICTPAQ
jgi:CheY-like chemotaxis protein